LKAFILKIWHKFRSFILYAIIGCFNTLLDFLVFTGAHELLHLSPEISHILGYVAGFISGFVLNRNITFRKENSANVFMQVFKFLIVNLLSLGSSTLVLHLLTGAGLNEYIAKILAQIVVTLINFFGYRFFVFRKDKDPASTEAPPHEENVPGEPESTEGENEND
jgi:putative flippase GtrA